MEAWLFCRFIKKNANVLFFIIKSENVIYVKIFYESPFKKSLLILINRDKTLDVFYLFSADLYTCSK